jgi:hypothetical protein
MNMPSQNPGRGPASRLGFWCALLTTLAGVVYFLAMVGLVLTGRLTFPPSDGVQLFGGVISLLLCPAIVLVVVSLHAVTPAERKVFSQGMILVLKQ